MPPAGTKCNDRVCAAGTPCPISEHPTFPPRITDQNPTAGRCFRRAWRHPPKALKDLYKCPGIIRVAAAAGRAAAATAEVHGGRGRAGGGQPPDLEEMLKRGQDKVKQVMHGGGVPGPLAIPRCGRRLRRHRLAGVHVPRQSGRAGRADALRQVRREVSAGPAFPPALSDRRGASAEGDAPEHHRGRQGVGRRPPQQRRARVSAPRA